MKGLLDTSPISIRLELIIKNLALESSKENPNAVQIRSMIKMLEPSFEQLDTISKAYYLKAASKLIDMEQGDV
ncbi:hypothetical protein D3C80_1732190 [compost metagenome]